MIVARLLGADGLGAVAYAVWLSLMLTPLIDSGMSSAVARYVPELRAAGQAPEADALARRMLKRLLLGVILLPAACAAILLIPGAAQGVSIGAPAGFGDGPMFWAAIALLVACQACAQFFYAYLRGSRSFAKLAGFTLLGLVAQTAFVTLGCVFFGVIGAICGYIAGQAAGAISALVFGLARSGGYPSEALERAWRYARFAWIANVANAFVWSRVEIFFLERSWGAEAVGVFSVALALTSIATQGPVLLTAGALPMLAEHQGRGEFEEMKRACATGTRMLALAVFPCCFGAAAIAPSLVPLIYGPDFVDAVLPAIILLLAAAGSAATVIATNFVYAMERGDFIFVSSLLGAVFAVSAGFLLVPAFGVLGAAAARASIQLFVIALGAWFIVRRLKCPLPFGALGRMLAAAVACAAAAAPVAHVLPQPFGLMLAVPVGAVVYAVAVRLFGALTPSDAELLKSTIGALPRPAGSIGVALIRALARPSQAGVA